MLLKLELRFRVVFANTFPISTEILESKDL